MRSGTAVGLVFSLGWGVFLNTGMGMSMPMPRAGAQAEHACCPGGAPADAPEKSDGTPSCCLFAPGAGVGAVALDVPTSASWISLGAAELQFDLSSLGEFLSSAPPTGPPRYAAGPSSPRAPPLA